MGSGTVPCGRPDTKAAVDDILPSRSTSWVRYSGSYGFSPMYFLACRNGMVWLPDGDETLYQIL